MKAPLGACISSLCMLVSLSVNKCKKNCQNLSFMSIYDFLGEQMNSAKSEQDEIPKR